VSDIARVVRSSKEAELFDFAKRPTGTDVGGRSDMSGRADEWKVVANAAMDRYACGDDAAFDELYDLLAPRMKAFLQRRMRDPARVEDLVQQTFLQMHRARRHFTPGAEVTPWAFAIARRLFIDTLRKGVREFLVINDDGRSAIDRATANDAADTVAVRRELALRIAQELERVPVSNRIAFELVHHDGLSIAEAAQVLGTTAMAVKLRAHRASKALRAQLGDEVKRELVQQ
jgi:RNA polymerase sigma-70 factor (ECF subfamily)